MAKDYGCEDLLKVMNETKREIFEPVVPPTAICGPPPKRGESISFSVSLMEDEKDLVVRFAEKFSDRVSYIPNYNQDCEALVCGKKKTSSYPPSIKVLAAILTNGNLIDIAWVRECLSNRTFLDYKGYLLESVCGVKVSTVGYLMSCLVYPKFCEDKSLVELIKFIS